ncbi:MotA/TolQ/ExbB proton channel family protein [Verrucomicrobium spinosum]|uniref:MotA/TolQ/ExbB proton channel family protein n=1 Tax=Verrucomicrobium spinosum TaxID=2736 RepID=UPI0001744C7F|nr:MotA/TolQ/ExbB proton channel family protein [Verrucomicrobium spinosum]
MPDLLSKGGPLVWLLLCCFGLALAIFAERLAYFHRASLNVGEFLAGLASLIRRKNFSEALQECVATRVPVGRVLHAALLRHHVPREQLKEIVQEAGQLEVPRLERYLSVLHGIAHAAPLIGLLGTIAGLMDTFTQLNNVNGYATPADVARGVYQSLITSALGLVVAIPSFLFYSFLAAKARHLMHDLERAGIEVVNILDDHRESAQSVDSGAQIVEFRQSDSGMRKIGKNA